MSVKKLDSIGVYKKYFKKLSKYDNFYLLLQEENLESRFRKRVQLIINTKSFY